MIVNPLDLPGSEFLSLYVMLLLAAGACIHWLRASIGPETASNRTLSPLDLAYLAGGSGRIGDVTLVDLLASKGAVLSADGRKIDIAGAASPSQTTVPPVNAKSFRINPGIYTRAQFQSAVQPLVQSARSRLEQAELIPDAGARGSYRFGVLIALGIPLVLGIAKLMTGIERHKPVGFLIALLVLTVFALLVTLVPPRATRAGRSTLADHKERHARAARAPLPSELPLAVSLAGLGVLAGTDYAILQKVSRGDSSGCGTSGDSGGGDGGGGCGGGCGGCSS